MRLSIFFLLFFCLAIAQSLFSQTLEYEDFIRSVKLNHPLSRQANMLMPQARAAQKGAKGAFDPKLYAEHWGKQFKDKTYFQHTEAGVKWPFWAGLELKGAFNQNAGAYLNPEATLPDKGQFNLGFTWSAGQGLLMDERRAGLKMAEYALSAAEAERRARTNDLLLDAAKTYWEWRYASNALTILDAALEQAQLRHAGIRASYLQGERSAYDTLESYIQVQTRLVDQQFAQVEAQNTAIALGACLWNENTDPLASVPSAPAFKADDAQAGSDTSLLGIALKSHPALQLGRIKGQQLQVERKLKAEKRKPILDFQYYMLGNGWELFPGAEGIRPSVLVNDVKWGIDFSYPIFNRKASAEMEINRLKMAQNDLELTQKQQQIEAKVRQYANDLQNLGRQTQLFHELSSQYRKLLDGENERLFTGESSLFLVNTREQRWLDAQLKHLKLWVEYQKCAAGLAWAAGVLGD